MELVKALLGIGVFESAYAAGRTLQIPQAIALARTGRYLARVES